MKIDLADTGEREPKSPHAGSAPSRRVGRRARRWKIAGALALVVMVVGLALRDTSPVGHFASAQGRDRFMATYERAMRALPPPDSTLDVRTDYGVVRFYRFEGASPELSPLVLLPGRASASPVWADNLPSLRSLRTVYTVDLLGEPGASVQDRPIENDDDQARWLHQALAGLPEPKLNLFGVSIGGWTAMNLAARQPDKIASVSVLDPAATFAPMSVEAVVRSIPASVSWFPKSWRDSFNSWTANGAPVKQVPLADMIEAGMQTYALKLPSTITPFPEETLAGIRVPVLVIMAGRSVMHDSAAAADRARRTLRHGTVIVYPDASHAINGEYPQQIANDVGTFLARASR
jgi:pimeloyl-ACP methyl ester carboxylesterase